MTPDAQCQCAHRRDEHEYVNGVPDVPVECPCTVCNCKNFTRKES